MKSASMSKQDFFTGLEDPPFPLLPLRPLQHFQSLIPSLLSFNAVAACTLIYKRGRQDKKRQTRKEQTYKNS